MSTAPERTLPDAISEAIEDYADAVWIACVDVEREYEDVTEPAATHLRQVILAALEPERALRERAERLRSSVEHAKWRYEREEPSVGFGRPERSWVMYHEFDESGSHILQPGDLTDDLLTAKEPTQ